MIQNNWKYYLPAVLWAVVIVYLSAFPAPQTGIEFEGMDKVAHLAAYGVLAFLMAGGFYKSEKQLTKKAIYRIAILAIALGIAMELMQYWFFPNRYFEYGDMVANTVGCVLGIGTIRIFINYKK